MSVSIPIIFKTESEHHEAQNLGFVKPDHSKWGYPCLISRQTDFIVSRILDYKDYSYNNLGRLKIRCVCLKHAMTWGDFKELYLSKTIQQRQEMNLYFSIKIEKELKELNEN